MHLANQSSGKPDTLSQSSPSKTSYPRVQQGENPKYKGRVQGQGVRVRDPVKRGGQLETGGMLGPRVIRQ